MLYIKNLNFNYKPSLKSFILFINKFYFEEHGIYMELALNVVNLK